MYYIDRNRQVRVCLLSVALQKKYYKAILTKDLGMHDKRTVHMPYPAW